MGQLDGLPMVSRCPTHLLARWRAPLLAVCNANETVTRYLGKMKAFLNLTKHHIAI